MSEEPVESVVFGYVQKMMIRKMIEMGHLDKLEQCNSDCTHRCGACADVLAYAGVSRRTPLYLAAKMTGMEDDNRPLLRASEGLLRDRGFRNIYNPANLPQGWTRQDYIGISTLALQASAVLVLCGPAEEWKTSGGVGIERKIAKYHGKIIVRFDCLVKLYQEDKQ